MGGACGKYEGGGGEKYIRGLVGKHGEKRLSGRPTDGKISTCINSSLLMHGDQIVSIFT